MNDMIAFNSRLDRRISINSDPTRGRYSRAPWLMRAASIFTDYFFGFVLALLLALMLAAAAQA